MQYQLGVASTTEKLAILRAELANTTAGTDDYYSILGQIAALEKQAADDAQRDKDRVTDAQLQYNLALADTPGKIALMQAELAKAIPGSAEYYQILTKIHALQEQYNKELDKLGATDIGASLGTGVIEPLGTASEAGKNLADALKEAFAPIGPASEDVKKLGDSITGLIQTVGTLFGIDFSTWFANNKKAVDTTGWDKYGELVEANTTKAQQATDKAATELKNSADETDRILRQMKSNYKVVMDLITGDLDQFWIDWDENNRIGNEDTDKRVDAGTASWSQKYTAWFRQGDIDVGDYIGHIQTRWKNWFESHTGTQAQWLIDLQGQWTSYYTEHASKFGDWLGDIQRRWKDWFFDTTSDVSDWFSDIGDAFFDGGQNVISDFWDGLKDKWGDVADWFSDKLQALRDQLPFSEPKDPDSPLRGLRQSGAAMVDMFQGGITSAALNVNPLANSLLATPSGGSGNSGDTATHITFGNIIINGAATVEDVRKGLDLGIADGLRQRGLKR